MPDFRSHYKNISIKSFFKLIAGILFLGIGLYILFTTFKNNYVLVGATKLWFGGILCLYGLVRILRIYYHTKNIEEDHEHSKN